MSAQKDASARHAPQNICRGGNSFAISIGVCGKRRTTFPLLAERQVIPQDQKAGFFEPVGQPR
jgi:hypothetical protein